MRGHFRPSALFAHVMLMSVALAAPSTAQNLQPASPDQGILQLVMRTYFAEFSDGSTPMAVSTPNATPLPPDGTVGMLGISIWAYDSSPNANNGYAFEVRADARMAELQPPSSDVQPLDIPGVGDAGEGFVHVGESPDGPLSRVQVAVLDGQFVYSVTAFIAGPSGGTAVRPILDALVTAGATIGEGTFEEDGTSSGGLWDKFALVDEMVGEVSDVQDRQLYPERSGIKSGTIPSTRGRDVGPGPSPHVALKP